MASRPGSQASASDAARSFARVRVHAPDRDLAERLSAEAYEAGAVGLEEREAAGGIALILYAPETCAGAVARVVRECAGGLARVTGPEPVPAEDWSEAWKAGLAPIDVSPRLRIRPSFAEASGAGGAAELVIDPGQAFGTGSHASTRLALEWIDRLAPALPPGSRILDVGCGTGVLALAALRLSDPATRAVALDLDAEAARASRANAQRNGLSRRLDVVRGSLDALREEPFALVVANLLRTELLPLLHEIARRTTPGGFAVLSGLLDAERGEVEQALAPAGLALHGVRTAVADGDRWLAFLTGR